ncbi:hypothetical protein [Bradyrhizobium tropiciagri]|uniref:hypothetical protein n=1 Tax=Bradyrhizobium tropiciagri TaxID=312253 RepID=UPI00067C77BD|nr:hypothetical protein [Bradyrhizobium tropiciagri]
MKTPVEACDAAWAVVDRGDDHDVVVPRKFAPETDDLVGDHLPSGAAGEYDAGGSADMVRKRWHLAPAYLGGNFGDRRGRRLAVHGCDSGDQTDDAGLRLQEVRNGRRARFIVPSQGAARLGCSADICLASSATIAFKTGGCGLF